MEPQNIIPISPTENSHINLPKTVQKNEKNFEDILAAHFGVVADDVSKTTNPAFTLLPPDIPLETTFYTTSDMNAKAAYKKQENQYVDPGKINGLQKYKDDQLLSNPGGDHYYLEQKRVVTHPKDQESFWGRIGKDISDAFSNVKNFFHDLLFGSKIRYRDENNQIREANQRGLVGSVVDFFKDLGSALSFGTWRPDGEEEPQGFVKRACFFFSKIKEAVFGDLALGVAGSVIRMGEDIIFAGWNLLETIPDATIGNFKKGRELITGIFDNGQVVLDYLTDVLPFGEAWTRVHSPNLKELKAPLIYNMNMPEHSKEDIRWRYVRNTPFRKTIETIGSLLSYIIPIKILGDVKLFGEERHQKD